ncbi:MAG: type IX secretion system membrane protein PorP/SprF [Bacteroidetes bacterium]|nr:MAG: type IX secretion system membrane protein PorP/SprF [Bacteroidota bacterium]TAG87203.1 MAG: type IX secretion system membrane protein PorP/SprF [Bacteroidota bacterium]
MKNFLQGLRKIILVSIINIGIYTNLFAQQDPQFSQYMFNMLAVNPAYAGSIDNTLTVTGLGRIQWVNFAGAPNTQTISIHAPLMNNTVGVGGQIVADQIGISKTLAVIGTGAYRIKFRKGVLAMGLQGGFRQYSANYTSVNTSLSGAYDPAFASNVTEMMPIIGAGLFYNTDKFYAAISTPQLLRTSQQVQQQVGNFSVTHESHFFLTSGYVFTLNPTMKLKPSIMVKYVNGGRISADFNANLWFYDKFGIGASYRYQDAIYAMVEYQLSPNLFAGYAFDQTITKLSRVNNGSHELILRYQTLIGRGKKERMKILTPRLF